MGFIVGLLAVILVLAVIFVVYSFGALILSWAWNTFMPLVWHAAPMLPFWPALATIVLLSIIASVFGRRG